MAIFNWYISIFNHLDIFGHLNFPSQLAILCHVDIYSCWNVLFCYDNVSCRLIVLCNVNPIIWLVFPSHVDLTCQLHHIHHSTLFVNLTTFMGFLRHPSIMPNCVILAWFFRWFPSFAIFSNHRLPLGKSSQNKVIPNGAYIFSPFGYDLVGSKLLHFVISNSWSSKFCMNCIFFITSWRTIFSHSHLVYQPFVRLNSFSWISSLVIRAF